MWKKEGLPREEFLRRAARIEGVYVPAFYETVYHADGTVESFGPKPEYKNIAAPVIRKRVVERFDDAYFPEKLVVPFSNVVHDRIMIEVMRGCSRGCRFCQAGFIYRPVRERSVSRIIEIAEKLVKATGYEEISLLSLSTDVYKRQVCIWLIQTYNIIYSVGPVT